MSLSFSQTPGNGVTLSFPITLEGGYISADDIVVEFITIADGSIAVQSNSTYEITLSGNVMFYTAPPATVEVRIRRAVSNDSTFSTFTRGSAFGQTNLNNSFLWSLYQLQQLADGFLPDDHYWKSPVNSGGNKLINVAPGENDGEVVTYEQLAPLVADYEDIEDLIIEAQDAADEAGESASAAAASAASILSLEHTASTSASNAATSATAAASSATAASGSATSASSSATLATTKATAASTSASNAATSASAASGSASAASTSASNAATSASAASGSASAASGSASNAAASAAAAASAVGGVNVMDYGAAGNGTTNDRTAIYNAAAALGVKGGVVLFPPGKYLIDTALTIPANVFLVGTYKFVGKTDGANYGNLSALIINSSVTVTLSEGAGVFGHLVIRKGMTFPTTSDTSFAGTAFTFNGDDCSVMNSAIFGFNTAIYSTGHQRPNIINVQFDNRNNLDIRNVLDVGRVRNCQAWPFTIYPNSGTYKRTGTSFSFSSVGDWNKITDCFCWGYRTGFNVTSCNNVTLLSCGADGPMEDTLSVGFDINGTSADTNLIGCQAAGQYTGYKIATSDGLLTALTACFGWGNHDHAILVSGGDAIINGGGLKNSGGSTGAGVTYNNANSRIRIDNLKNICTTPFNQAIAPAQISKGCVNTGSGWNDFTTSANTFTPTLKFGGNSTGMTYQSWTAGRWERLGNRITVTGQIALSAKGSSTGVLTISGLPVTPQSGDDNYVPVTLSVEDITYTGVIQANVIPGTSTIAIYQVTEAGAKTQLTNANVSNSTNIKFSATYYV